MSVSILSAFGSSKIRYIGSLISQRIAKGSVDSIMIGSRTDRGCDSLSRALHPIPWMCVCNSCVCKPFYEHKQVSYSQLVKAVDMDSLRHLHDFWCDNYGRQIFERRFCHSKWNRQIACVWWDVTICIFEPKVRSWSVFILSLWDRPTSKLANLQSSSNFYLDKQCVLSGPPHTVVKLDELWSDIVIFVFFITWNW